jgi:outer membrane protein TolC
MRLASRIAPAVLVLLAGCGTFSPDGGMSVPADIVTDAMRMDVAAIRSDEEAAAARARVTRLLARRLTADVAAQIALLNNRGLQAAYNELGIAEAIRVQDSIPANPTFTFERISGPVEIEIEKRIIANILSLATLPVRAEIATDRFHQAQLRAAEETVRVAQDARRAFYRAVAARARVAFLAQSQSSAEAATKLMQRLGETGAVNKLDQAREQSFYAEITAQLATARQHAASERERLTRILGFWGPDLDFRLPDALPPLPARPKSLPSIETEAVARRIDLQIARIELVALSKTLGFTQATRFINLLEVSGVSRTTKERETGEKVRDRGFELEIQIPIFDGGEARVRQASETYMRAVNHLVDRAVSVRSQARDAYRTYRSTYDIARHYQREVLPLRKIISDETLLQYNAMQIDVFALLVEARQRIAVTIAAMDAQRDYWLAKANLLSALVGGGTAGEPTSEALGVARPATEQAGH